MALPGHEANGQRSLAAVVDRALTEIDFFVVVGHGLGGRASKRQQRFASHATIRRGIRRSTPAHAAREIRSSSDDESDDQKPRSNTRHLRKAGQLTSEWYENLSLPGRSSDFLAIESVQSGRGIKQNTLTLLRRNALQNPIQNLA